MKISGKTMSKIRILEVSKSTGGLLTYMRWLAHGIDRERFDMTFACLSENGRELAEELARIPGTHTLSWPMNRFKINIASDARVIFRLAKLLRSGQFDIVHGHGSKAGFMVRIAAIGTGVKTAYSPHGFAFHERQKPAIARVYALVERFAARFLTTRIITVSDGERLDARRNRVGAEEKFVTVHSGIQPELFGNPVDKMSIRASLDIPKDAFLVGTVGRLNPQKAPLDFVKVAAATLAKHSNAHFIFIGDGELEPEARALSRQMGINHALTFAGNRSDVPQLLSVMDCFLLTSHWEAFPIVILEAMASRLPVVATALTGTLEALTDGVEGLTARPGDIDGLSTAIERLMADPVLASRLGANARARIEREFTRQTMMQNLMGIYKQMVTE
jgi:glycosyltransferase involved in cell wall biosynthesis